MAIGTVQHQPVWWKEGVVYEIYVASFKDSNNDGLGDLPGIISKLDYLRDLGIDIIWVSPHYKSPQVDMGYDISDFQDVHEPYGTIQDCDRLIEETHIRGMKVIFDLVINHTSDKHPWFIESRSSKTNAKRDWYFWREPKVDEYGNRIRPNNWRSQFTTPAWTWDAETEEYYLHVYASGQPDLNFENEECRRALYDNAIKFWLDRGVDGFRVDTVNKYSKVPGLPDAPVTDASEETQFAVCRYANGPRIHEYLQEIREILARYNVMTVGELPNTPDLEDVLKYVSPSSGELDMVFNFDAVTIDHTPGNRFLPLAYSNADFKHALTKWQTLPETTGAWTTAFLENHDQGRSVSRFASDLPEYRVFSAKMLATVLATMTGTLYLYQGQEIGMTNMPLSTPADQYQCVRSVNYYSDVCARTGNDPKALEVAKKNLQRVARDHARVPMQWDDTANAGFCGPGATPWMPALENHVEINVRDQNGRPGSVLEFWRTMIRYRKTYAALFVYGTFTSIDQHPDLLMFVKTDITTQHRALTVANLSQSRVDFQEPQGFPLSRAVVLVQNYAPKSSDGSLSLTMRPFEARVYMSQL
ncbi:glycoside hydrolase [Sarocladium strictum]